MRGVCCASDFPTGGDQSPFRCVCCDCIMAQTISDVASERRGGFSPAAVLSATVDGDHDDDDADDDGGGSPMALLTGRQHAIA